MARVSVQKVPEKEVPIDRLLAQFCYYFQQYTYEEARKLPYKRIKIMLKEAGRREAENYINLLNISVAAQDTKGRNIRKLLDFYRSIIDA